MSDQQLSVTRGHSFDSTSLGHYSFEQSPLPMVAVEGPRHVVRCLNPAFAHLVGKTTEELVGRPFIEVVPEEIGGGHLALLDRVFETGVPEHLAEEKRRAPSLAYWSYSAWAIFGEDGRPAGVMIQVTDSTGIARFRHQAVAVNEELVLSSVRQHELVDATESLNVQLREEHDQLEGRVAERTAELAEANASLRAEIKVRETAEAERLDLLQRLATAQEDERRRIARELHDQMGQLLTALGLGLKTLEAATPGSSHARQQLAELQELTNQIGREVHNLALELRPTALDDFGLQTALGHYAVAWSAQSGVEVDFQNSIPDGTPLPDTVKTALYRVAQEALTNVFRHAGAHRVSLILQWSPGQTMMVIEDDGVGFDTESATNLVGRLGLLGMRERVALVGGALTIESTPGCGTTVIARVPLHARRDEEASWLRARMIDTMSG